MSRLNLHEKLTSILGTRNVYFQPPATVKMSYPCIIYDLMDIDEKYANNDAYLSKEKYKITLSDSGEVVKVSLTSEGIANFLNGLTPEQLSEVLKQAQELIL